MTDDRDEQREAAERNRLTAACAVSLAGLVVSAALLLAIWRRPERTGPPVSP
ncbi:hypothetical protein ACFVVX_11495 [Kitasatospora sp. NPDC058170]|uniref:hypothetical protein n=1 Tax=Kitasatospora sp. NPDC058170 TaxID=3346364 RepID=UPI0036DA9718